MIPCDSADVEIDRPTADQPVFNALTFEFGMEIGDRRQLFRGEPFGRADGTAPFGGISTPTSRIWCYQSPAGTKTQEKSRAD